MARPVDPSFPKTRHLALDLGDGTPLAEAVLSAPGPVPAVDQPAKTPEGALGQAAPGTPVAAGAPAAAAQEGAPQPSQPPPPAVARLVAVDLSAPASDPERCAALDGTSLAIRCVSSLEGRRSAAEAVAFAARSADAVLLDNVDRWYRLGPEGAGFCTSCDLALVELLRDSYGDHVAPFDALAQVRAAAGPLRERPFGKQREVLRLAESLEAGKRAVLAARDEARRERGLELAVLGRSGPIGPASLLLCRHLDGLVFDLASADPVDGMLPLLAARAALGHRPAVAVAPKGVSATAVRQLAALATAFDADLALPQGASPEAVAALAAHRRFFVDVRERYRPAAALADAEILLSPNCDHWTSGAHMGASAQVLAALVRAQLQPAVRLDLVGGTRSRLLIIAGAAALSPQDAAAARRHLEAGGDVLLAGKCFTIDEEGRTGDPVFPEADDDEVERVKEGRLYTASDLTEARLAKGLRELVGRGRSQVVVAGRGRVLARAYLDPERKLDVHLVNLDPALTPAQGVQLSIAGQAAGGGRTGYWFAPERAGGKDGERITLNPSGFSVSTILPSVAGYALLTVPR